MPDAEIQTPDEKLPVDWREREELLPNDWNPNMMSEEKRTELIHSILDNGWTQPIVVKKGTDEIIDGEQRWHASRDARIRTNEELTPDGVPAGLVPVFYMDVDETQAMVATMQHNVNGSTDANSLGNIFKSLDEEGLFYETAKRFQIGETGIDRLIEQAEAPEESPSAFYEELDEDDDPEAFTESLEFQMTAEEHELVTSILDSIEFTQLMNWAVENNVHSQTRVDMRELADRNPVYEYGEDTIEYPSVDVERHLRSYIRDDDPELEETDD